MPQITIWCMHILCWIAKATNTHSEYVIHIAFPLHQWLYERASVLCLTYIFCSKVKVNVVQALRLCTGRTVHRGSRGIALLFHDQRQQKVVRGQRYVWAAIYLQERPATHCTGGWVGPRVGLDRCQKSRPPPGFNPRTVQPVASRYTN